MAKSDVSWDVSMVFPAMKYTDSGGEPVLDSLTHLVTVKAANQKTAVKAVRLMGVVQVSDCLFLNAKEATCYNVVPTPEVPSVS